jgi:hypothetical protein
VAGKEGRSARGASRGRTPGEGMNRDYT